MKIKDLILDLTLLTLVLIMSVLAFAFYIRDDWIPYGISMLLLIFFISVRDLHKKKQVISELIERGLL